MKEGQEAIYYITADTLAAAKSSPQLEIFRKKGIEVLLLIDRVDEWMLAHLFEFDGKPLQNVARGAVDLGKLQDEEEKKKAEQAADAFKPVLERLKTTLKERAKDVRVTTRLVDSPACLVVEEGDMSTHLARLLKQAGQEAPKSQPILEVNAEHALVKRLANDERFDDLAHVLFDQALLAEGGSSTIQGSTCGASTRCWRPELVDQAARRWRIASTCSRNCCACWCQYAGPSNHGKATGNAGSVQRRAIQALW